MSGIWVPLDKFLAGRNLSHAPWVPGEHRGLSGLVSPFAVHALAIWDALNKTGRLALPTSPLAPLGGFPWFAPGEHPSFFRTWAEDGESRCGRFVQDRGLLPLATLREQYGPFLMDEPFSHNSTPEGQVTNTGVPLRAPLYGPGGCPPCHLSAICPDTLPTGGREAQVHKGVGERPAAQLH